MGTQPNMFYQVPNGMDEANQIANTHVQYPTPVAPSLYSQTPAVTPRAPSKTAMPAPGAVFSRYGTPYAEYGGMPNTQPAQVYMPGLEDTGINRANDQARRIRSTQVAYPSLYGST